MERHTSSTASVVPEIGAERIARLEANVASVLRGKDDVIRLAVVSLLARGHVLIEDVPGVGKTTLAHALAISLGLSFQRIQFTSDLLPSDILGVSIFKQDKQEFEFVPGPIFANIVLADEINRATPKSQSALLEGMSEGMVSIERRRLRLPRPFLVLATQNPLEHQGTFPLPESQLDRFMMSLQIGYPPVEAERELLLSGGVDQILSRLKPVLDETDLATLQSRAAEIRVEGKLADYILAIARHTREDGEFVMGVSTRGVQSLYRAAQATALCEGRDFAVPDDVQRVAVSVLAHRVLLRQGLSGGIEVARRAIDRVVSQVPVPV
ncbi:MAG: MoxR family ATPase [Thermoanaerobaculia bacterium]|nr:MoxR family ATPase [Thermoanaerobaculia bacterium]